MLEVKNLDVAYGHAKALHDGVLTTAGTVQNPLEITGLLAQQGQRSRDLSAGVLWPGRSQTQSVLVRQHDGVQPGVLPTCLQL